MQIGKLVADHKMHGALMLELERMRWKLSDAHLKAAEDYKRIDSLVRVRKSLEAQITLLESHSNAGREAQRRRAAKLRDKYITRYYIYSDVYV